MMIRDEVDDDGDGGQVMVMVMVMMVTSDLDNVVAALDIQVLKCNGVCPQQLICILQYKLL